MYEIDWEICKQTQIEANLILEQQNYIEASLEMNIVPDVQGSELITVNKTGDTYKITSINYTHEQAIATDVWVINHNLNKCPSIYVVDTAGHMQMPDDIMVNDMNTITVTFLAAFAGKAYLN